MSFISSPCIKICIMDAASGLCQGCGRTLDEIAGWTLLDEAARKTLMAELPRRLQASRDERRAAAGRLNARRAARTRP